MTLPLNVRPPATTLLPGAFVCALTCVFALSACDRVGAGPRRYHIDSLPVLVANVEQRYGSRDNPDLGFSEIGGLDVDRDGNLYVLDVRDLQIRVYTPDFRPLRKIGRAGNGPGEFEGWPDFGVVGDTVWSIDGWQTARITLFSRDGAVLSTGGTPGVRILLPQLYGYVRPTSMRPDGHFTSEMSMVSSLRGGPPTGVQPTDSIPIPRVLFAASGAVVDTIGWHEKPPPRMWRAPGSYPEEGRRSIRINDEPYTVPDPPTVMPSWHTVHYGTVIVESLQPASAADTNFTVTRLTLSRDTVFHTALWYKPPKYEPAELDAIAKRGASRSYLMEAAAGDNAALPPPPDPAVVRRLREEMKFPSHKLLIADERLVGPDEKMWLKRADGTDRVGRWIVVGRDGKPEGRLELPEGVEILWHRGDIIWAAVPDEMDVPWLVKYRLARR